MQREMNYVSILHASMLNITYKLPLKTFERVTNVRVILCYSPNISSALSSRHMAKLYFLTLVWLDGLMQQVLGNKL